MTNKQKIKTASKFVATFAIAMAATGAHAMDNKGGLGLGLLGAATIQNPSVKDNGSSANVKGKTAFGGGVSAELGVREGLGIEADLLYLSHKFSQGSVGGVTGTASSGYLQLPVLVRYRPIPYVNLGLGAYYSRVVKAWAVTGSSSGTSSVNYGKNDFGAVVALGTNIPVTDAMSIVADLRYARSLTDSARDSGDALKFSDFQILAGVRVGF